MGRVAVALCLAAMAVAVAVQADWLSLAGRGDPNPDGVNCLHGYWNQSVGDTGACVCDWGFEGCVAARAAARAEH